MSVAVGQDDGHGILPVPAGADLVRQLLQRKRK